MVAEGKRKSFGCEEGNKKPWVFFHVRKKMESKIPGRNKMLFKEGKE